MKVDEIQKLIAELIPVIKEYVDQTIGGLREEQKAALEGINQYSADDIAIAAAKLVEPAKDGEDGEDGKGVDLTEVELMVAEQLSRALETLEIPEDGEPGKDALELDVLPAIDFEKSYQRGTFATHNGGLWRAHAKTDSKRGWECIVRGESGVNVSMDGHRTFVIATTDTAGHAKENRFTIPAWIYRKVWKEGETYDQGDVVTWGGSLWHCDETTRDKPMENSKAWTLCAKKGRDGKR